VYLPQGTWWDYWTGERLEGGRDVTAKAALDSMPLYVKAGAIVSMGQVKQFTTEKANRTHDPEDLSVRGRHLRWYDYDGTSFEYERGKYIPVNCEWNDSSRTLQLTHDAWLALQRAPHARRIGERLDS